MFDIWNRRYTGSKYKLSSWISELIAENCNGSSFCDIFAGTGIVSYTMLDKMKKIYKKNAYNELNKQEIYFIII